MFRHETSLVIVCIIYTLLCPTNALLPEGYWKANGDSNGDLRDNREFGSVHRVGDLKAARYNHTSTLLEDGRVLAAGGTGNGRISLGTAELYDPGNGMWEETTNMSIGRMRHTATLMDSGKVLIAGGFSGDGRGHPSLIKHFNGTGNLSLDSCETFDPIHGSFSPAPGLNTGRFWHRSVKLHNGRILIIGGVNVSLGVLSSCEVFDPVIKEWTEAAALDKARVRFSATLLGNGSVLVTGGHAGMKKEPFASCEIYVPEKDAWYNVTSMNRARGYHSAIAMADGRVLVSGGFAGKGMPDWNDSEIFDPVANSWLFAGNMSLPRHNHVSARVEGGEILIFGGTNCLTGGGHSGIEYYDPAPGDWSHTNLVIMGLKWTTAMNLEDGSILICGGRVCYDPSNFAYLYLPPGHTQGGADDDEWILRGFESLSSVMAVLVTMVILVGKGRRGR